MVKPEKSVLFDEKLNEVHESPYNDDVIGTLDDGMDISRSADDLLYSDDDIDPDFQSALQEFDDFLVQGSPVRERSQIPGSP
jgi:hypothetical protein